MGVFSADIIDTLSCYVHWVKNFALGVDNALYVLSIIYRCTSDMLILSCLYDACRTRLHGNSYLYPVTCLGDTFCSQMSTAWPVAGEHCALPRRTLSHQDYVWSLSMIYIIITTGSLFRKWSFADNNGVGAKCIKCITITIAMTMPQILMILITVEKWKKTLLGYSYHITGL